MKSKTPRLDAVCEMLDSPGGMPKGLNRCGFGSLEFLQTPGVWGRDCAAQTTFHEDAGARLIEAVEGVVASGSRLVDISSLEPYASGHFLDAIARGLKRMDARGERTVVRILFGNNPYSKESDAGLVEMLRFLTRDLDPSSLLSVHACRMYTRVDGLRSSWNHSKIVASDGRQCIVGGHNLWSDDYFAEGPVHDLSALLTGAGAAECHLFLNHLWEWVGSNLCQPSGSPTAFAAGWNSGVISEGLIPSSIGLESPGEGGGIPSLAVARYGGGIFPDDREVNVASRVAAAAFRLAQHSIIMSQMDFALRWNGPSIWPDEVMEALTEGLVDPERRLAVRIVVTEPGGIAGGGGSYSFGETPEGVVEEFRGRIGGRPVTGSLMVAPIRFQHGIDLWEAAGKKIKITNHAKLWMVDERTFHIGSDNIYPHNLQEFGYVIEDPSASAELLRSYWTPLWTYSSPVAVKL